MPRLLAFIPHPDDESYSFGGLLALAARAGWECAIRCASSGEKGKRHDGGNTRPNDVAEAREEELGRSCAVLGIAPPEFWGLPDGELRVHRGEQPRIFREIERFRPDIVLTLGPDGAYGHPDHLAVHRWVTGAWESLPGERPALLFPVFPAGLFVPQWEKCLRMMGDPPRPAREEIGGQAWQYEVPIAAVAEVKRRAVAAHRSQLPGGEVEAIFPPGILVALLERERYTDARGVRDEKVAALLSSLGPG